MNSTLPETGIIFTFDQPAMGGGKDATNLGRSEVMVSGVSSQVGARRRGGTLFDILPPVATGAGIG